MINVKNLWKALVIIMNSKKNAYGSYRMYSRKVLAGPSSGNIDTRYYAQDFTATRITFKARNEKEAMRKADKFWRDGQFGMGSIIVKEE
jgi:hypothetical protein